MTQDCSTSSSLKRLPKGIRIISHSPSRPKEPERVSSPTVPVSVQSKGSLCPHSPSLPKEPDQQSWGYVYIPHGRVERFLELIEYIAAQGEFTPPTFVHRSPRRDKKSEQKTSPQSSKKKPKSAKNCGKSSSDSEPQDPLTVSGLVFLQGETRELQLFLNKNFQNVYLVNDCATNRPASIPQSQMKPFMDLMTSNPYEITLLRDSFEKFANNRVKLRLLTGPFAGHEGFIVRIHRDRQLVMQLGGITIALRGVHRETFEVVSL